jgi:hypothetical protein
LLSEELLPPPRLKIGESKQANIQQIDIKAPAYGSREGYMSRCELYPHIRSFGIAFPKKKHGTSWSFLFLQAHRETHSGPIRFWGNGAACPFTDA